jgi:hypothetical protein
MIIRRRDFAGAAEDAAFMASSQDGQAGLDKLARAKPEGGKSLTSAVASTANRAAIDAERKTRAAGIAKAKADEAAAVAARSSGSLHPRAATETAFVAEQAKAEKEAADAAAKIAAAAALAAQAKDEQAAADREEQRLKDVAARDELKRQKQAEYDAQSSGGGGGGGGGLVDGGPPAALTSSSIEAPTEIPWYYLAGAGAAVLILGGVLFFSRKPRAVAGYKRRNRRAR